MIRRFTNDNELLRFVACDEPLVPEDDLDVPLTWAMVVIQRDEQFLLHHNFNRMQWECAGGGIEAGESVAQAAMREVLEETSQQVRALVCRGVFKLKLHHDQRVEYGALYTGIVDTMQPFVINNESDRITWWKPDDVLDDRLSELSAWMISYVSNGHGDE